KVSFHLNETTPRLIIVDPEMVKDVMSLMIEKNGNILKPPVDSYNPLITDLPKGVTNQEGEKWFKHRRNINPGFRVSITSMVLLQVGRNWPDIYILIARWKKLADTTTGSCEFYIWPEMETLTSDIISRTAFGSNYEEGKRLFELQNEQIAVVIEAIRFLQRSNITESSNRLTIEEVIEECKVEEVEQICGKEYVPDFNAINRLKIVRVILRIPLILAHHDPVEFKPERFAEGVSSAPKDKLAYLPFSRGDKLKIQQHFAFQLVPSYTHAPCVVLNPHGAQIIAPTLS
ncbi:hypothetical protein MKX03_001730, partial [Papaver bracteatum]